MVGQAIYLGERRLAVATCRDEVVEAAEVLSPGGGEQVFTVGEVYAVMVTAGTCWNRSTVAKTMLRMTRLARRPPYVQLERVAIDRYRITQRAVS